MNNNSKNKMKKYLLLSIILLLISAHVWFNYSIQPILTESEIYNLSLENCLKSLSEAKNTKSNLNYDILTIIKANTSSMDYWKYDEMAMNYRKSNILFALNELPLSKWSIIRDNYLVYISQDQYLEYLAKDLVDLKTDEWKISNIYVNAKSRIIMHYYYCGYYNIKP